MPLPHSSPAAPMPSITLRPGCKVNIYLDVLERRSDGYHELLSLFVPLPEPCDVMTIRPAAPGTRLRLICRGRPIPGQDNILLRAYEAFAAASGTAPDLEVELTKRIPVGAGLGGGSSDAASLLRYLNSTCLPRPLDSRQLASLAATAGADAPFFLDNRPAWARGIGDALSPASLNLSGLGGVLVCPDVQVSTAWAYQAWDEAHAGRRPRPGLLTGQDRMDKVLPFQNTIFYNSFEHVVFPVHPHLRTIKEQLLRHGASGAAMSGSGSGIFALFRDTPPLERAVNWLEQKSLEFHVHWFNESSPMSPLRGLNEDDIP